MDPRTFNPGVELSPVDQVGANYCVTRRSIER